MGDKPTSAPVQQPPDLASLALAITEHAPLPMATVEGATRIVRYCNPAFCYLMGKPLAQLVGKPLDELLPAKDACMTLIERVLRTSSPESYIEQDPSKPHPVFWSYTIWPMKEDKGLVGIMIQVTETAEIHGRTVAMNQALILGSVRQHELTEAAENLNEQLRAEMAERKKAEEASARLAAIINSSDDAIISKDLDGIITSWNKGAENLFGYTAQEAIGQPIMMLIPSERMHEESEILTRIKRGERLDHFETVRVRKDGSRVEISLTNSPILNANGGVIGASKIARDNTERKKAEEALREASQALKDADRRKDVFLATLAHELRNPLAPIKNAAHVLRMLNVDNEAVKRAQGIIERQANHLAKLVDDLLDISRIQKGKFELHKEHLDLGKAVSRAVESCEQLIQLQDHTISVEIQDSPPIHIDADPTRVDQILINLITNAAKYTPSQGSIKISAALERGLAVVRVRDNGVGIEAQMLQRIFDVFTQVEQSLERRQGGLGLGLKLVKDLTEMHGGSVEAKSEGLNKGSEFIVRLPALEKPDPKLIAAEVIPEFRGSSKRILVVDDNVDIRESMEMVLSMSGHSVELAEDGPQAVQKALQMHLDVAFIDIGLPKMNGYDVARGIRNCPGGADIVLIAVSGYGQAEDKRKAHDAGFDTHLTKPVDTDVMQKILSELEMFHRCPA